MDKDLFGNEQISEEHIENNREVRAILLKRGVQPEALPASEDIKKVKRRLKKEETNVLETNKKSKRWHFFVLKKQARLPPCLPHTPKTHTKGFAWIWLGIVLLPQNASYKLASIESA